jgi:hypothetical protein
MRRIFAAIILVVTLSGCAGFWVSGNATGEAIELSGNNATQSGVTYFGIESAKDNHPQNGSKIYNERTEWCGLTIWAIIPIPLLLPVCKSYEEVTFTNGEPTKRVSHYVKGSGLLCGPFVLIPTGMDGGTSSFCSTKFH